MWSWLYRLFVPAPNEDDVRKAQEIWEGHLEGGDFVLRPEPKWFVESSYQTMVELLGIPKSAVEEAFRRANVGRRLELAVAVGAAERALLFATACELCKFGSVTESRASGLALARLSEAVALCGPDHPRLRVLQEAALNARGAMEVLRALGRDEREAMFVFQTVKDGTYTPQ